MAAIGWWVADSAAASSAFLPWGLTGLTSGGAFGLVVTPHLFVAPLQRGLKLLEELPSSVIVAGVAGLLVGLAAAALLSIPLTRIAGWAGVGVPLGLSVLCGALGVVVATRREWSLPGYSPGSRAGAFASNGRTAAGQGGRVVVDTSAIIDGRIADVSETGFLQGILVVPRFVLDELRHVADSSDSMRRNRGRRGLEVLTRLHKEAHVSIQVLDVDMPEGQEVDSKLVSLARDLKAPIVTTDFNLNRVAELQGVRVLNVNELANALKPVALPGEEMKVHVIQEGKEAGQGVAFLDDGTMVVVEGGRRHVGQHVNVTVSRVFQTAAGRIIFAQPPES